MFAHAPSRWGFPVVAGLIVASLGFAVPVQAQVSDLVDRSTLRVCADPANMPFTNEEGAGFENKIAELLASKLGLTLDYTWFPQATGFYRMTLASKRCDVVMGYVAGGDPVLNTNPYYRSAWVLVTKKDGDLAGVDTLEDPRLKGRHIGVIAGTPPADLLARNGLMAGARPYSFMVDRRFDSPAETMISDIDDGTIDAGILWGPIGGYFAKASDVPLVVVPLVKEKGDPSLIYRITFGIRPGELNWKHQLNGFITEEQEAINRILAEYGVPLLDSQNRPIEPAP
ncbi:quinoprotein dehydrogenase-associated putative ABC transporter substrate-binding protein [Ancylobacter pratisalsi]|uniref:Quinoprotein dehydrogenase-associated putative ABC transporter substrate-binding protein n=1 Tax=Ancylobacter pratisalsi TaxID=1745854 RepID=A0A6P1YPH1_9HYPH|nr:quinoprotein dehydrogenase-associated putative ABC transporter substrate-binding protein [Ancylobacter pratisalsi]QIB35328.1 quinoprotein dehydrogenase-associated putative ABC transporter substrate-binding protein [Ancylobacter pratisalsi]